jgi:soluble lytic murein transglycosylase
VIDHLRRESVPRARHVGAELVATARRHDVDPMLIVALMEIESGFRPGAKSAVGALGLLQVRPATAREVAEHGGLQWAGPAELYVPEVNVRLGILYLAELLDQFDDLEHALAAYNRGPAAVSRALSGGNPLPREFVERVWQTYQDLRAEIETAFHTESEMRWIATGAWLGPSFES